MDNGLNVSPGSMAMLARLGWIENSKLTSLGEIIKDPLREYGFWLGRHKLLPIKDSVPVVNRK